MGDTSVKWSIIKTFLFSSDFDEKQKSFDYRPDLMEVSSVNVPLRSC